MLELVSKLIVNTAFIIMLTILYGYLDNRNLDINLKNIVFMILGIVMISIMSFGLSKWPELLIKYMINLILFKLIYEDKLSKSLICTFLVYILFIIGEFLFGIIFVLLLRIDQKFLTETIQGYLFSNFMILIISLVLIRSKKIKSNLNNIVEWYMGKETFNTAVITTLGIVTLCFLLYKNYLRIESFFSFVLTSIFLIGVLIFIIGYFKEKTDNNKLTTEYDQLIDYVKTYEEMIEEKSKNQHEYNNQLILIREMLGTRNKKTKEYIDGILSSEKGLDESNWLNKFKNIPNGGLKGLIHYKVSEMLKKGIKVYIDINENVNTKKINKYLKDNLSDVSKIIGVYLDNAREAALESNDKYIIIEAECNEGQLDFSISNTYKGDINLNKIDSMGYSKKGKGRGYGLSLVKDIIDRRDDIEQYREFNGIYFVQKIIFKYKKNKT